MSSLEICSYSNTKLEKGEAAGWLSLILNLAPADSAEVLIDPDSPELGFHNLCPFASPLCLETCINKTGFARVSGAVIRAQISRTRWYFEDRESFLAAVRRDINRAIRKAQKDGLRLCVRINGTSDEYKLAKQMALEFPDVQFYDYTALPKPWLRTLRNYHLTFSLKEDNLPAALDALHHGINLAVVFPNDQPLPSSWRGIEVLNGDKHDLRFLDGYQSKVIGLKFKEIDLKKDKQAETHRKAAGFIQIDLATA